MRTVLTAFMVLILLILVMVLVTGVRLAMLTYEWAFYAGFAIAWLAVMYFTTIRSTLPKVSVIGLVFGLLFGTLILILGWITGWWHVDFSFVASSSFYFAVSFPVLFNLGYVKGKYRMP